MRLWKIICCDLLLLFLYFVFLVFELPCHSQLDPEYVTSGVARFCGCLVSDIEILSSTPGREASAFCEIHAKPRFDKAEAQDQHGDPDGVLDVFRAEIADTGVRLSNVEEFFSFRGDYFTVFYIRDGETWYALLLNML